MGRQATRAADTALGATVTAAESIAGAVRRDPKREYQRLRRDLDGSVRRFERRGAQARKRTTRELDRRRREAARALRRTGREVESRVDESKREARSAADDVSARVQERTGRL